MKKILSLILLPLLIPNLVWAAVYTGSVSGNWTASATWGGADPTTFTISDTATINKGISVTLNVDLNNGGSYNIGDITVGANAGGGSGLAWLLPADNITFNLAGNLTVGNGATADGGFNFAPGLILGTTATPYNIILGRGKLTSTATTLNWAKVTGSGAIQLHATDTAPKQDFLLTNGFVSFQNTGAITFSAIGTSGTSTNEILISHCTFIGQSALTFGTSGSTPLATDISITYCDFRNVGDIIVGRATGIPSGLNTFSHNTLDATTVKDISVRSLNLFLDDNVYGNFTNGVVTPASKGGFTISNSLSYLPTTSDSGKGFISLNEAIAAIALKDNYIYADYPNPHNIQVSGTGGSGTHQISGNVAELIFNADQGNVFMCTKLAANLYKNIVINGNLNAKGSNLTGVTFNNFQNTNYFTDVNTVGPFSAFYLYEFGTGTYTATFNVVNNLISGTVTIGTGLQSTSSTNQTITYAGYNDFHSVTTNYGNKITITSGPTGDLDEVAPSFIDPIRNIAKWNARFGSGTETAAAALVYLLARNGYNATTKTQSDTPSVNGPASLVQWVRYGFSPTNGILRKAGDTNYTEFLIVGSGDSSNSIGAMQWQNPRRKRAM